MTSEDTSLSKLWTERTQVNLLPGYGSWQRWSLCTADQCCAGWMRSGSQGDLHRQSHTLLHDSYSWHKDKHLWIWTTEVHLISFLGHNLTQKRHQLTSLDWACRVQWGGWSRCTTASRKLLQQTAYSELLSPTLSPNLLPSNSTGVQTNFLSILSSTVPKCPVTYNWRGRAVIDNDIRVSAQLHLILLLVQQSQTCCYVTGNQVCVLQQQRGRYNAPCVSIIPVPVYSHLHYYKYSITNREKGAEKLCDAGERCPVALILRQTTAQETEPALPHFNSQGASCG